MPIPPARTFLSALLFCLFCFVMSSAVTAESALWTGERKRFEIDFAVLPEQAREILQEQGFVYEKDMRDREKIMLSGNRTGLRLSTAGPTFGLMVKDGLRVEHADTVEIEWGIERYPVVAEPC